MILWIVCFEKNFARNFGKKYNFVSKKFCKEQFEMLGKVTEPVSLLCFESIKIIIGPSDS